MTSDNETTTPTEARAAGDGAPYADAPAVVPANDAEATAPGADADAASEPTAAAATKPTRRRASRKAAAPPPPTEQHPSDAVDAASGPEEGAEVPAEAPPARATRTRRATSTTTTTATRRTSRRATSADTGPTDAGPAGAPAAGEGAAAPDKPTLDVLAELAPVVRAATAVEVPPVSGDAPAEEPAEELEEEPTEADEPAASEGLGTAPSGSGPAGDEGGPRLATTALVFQPPQPTTRRAGRRRVVAPAGPPQLIVGAIAPQAPQAPPGPQAPPAPAAAGPRSTVTTSEGPSAPVVGPPEAEGAAEPRRRSRRASRPAAAPAPVEDAAVVQPVPGGARPDTEPAREPAAEPVEPARRRGSRRRGGSRAAEAVQELLGDVVDDTVLEDGLEVEPTDATEVADDDAPVAAQDELAEGAVEEDEDETGAPRRRRRRGGRGRRSRGGADVDGSRADADQAEPDEDEDEDASATDVDVEDEAAETDEGAGSSRRRRRRRRSGRGVEAAEVEAVPAARVRTARPASDEVTALRGSTRLEAKRQRRREGRDAGRRRQVITEAEFLARRESVDRTMVVRELDGRTQIAVLEDGVLVEHYVSRQAQTSMAGNVYLGRVQNVLPSMEAAFIDVGKGRNAVLYAGEVNWDAAGLEGQPRRIEQALRSGDSVLVQVTKDPIGHKGARLTSQITLAGRYLVYVPGGGMTGISRKLPDNERARLKKLLREIVPDSAGVIVRTAAEGASEEELRADISRLQDQWTAIEKKAKTASAPALLQGEPDLAIRVVRDIFNDDFGSLVVQGDEAWQTISGYISALAPDLASKVTRWTGDGDVFAAHRVDEQLAKGMDRKVWLPSGGSLVIDRTEAMTVVDVNTGKFTGSGGTLEETVTRNNLEAAEEIVRQLRLRDIGGIIVIDFIDMVLEMNRDLVLRRLVECLGRDRTKHQVAEVTSLGLVQMTRKRVGQGLVEAFSETCEHCNGRGFIVHTEPLDRGNGSPQPVPSAPQPAGTVADDPKRARRKRGGAKEQGATPSVATIPVLPEAREAVKATLATIAAAAAHAHEHEHDGHETPPAAALDAPAPTAVAPGTSTPVEDGSPAEGDGVPDVRQAGHEEPSPGAGDAGSPAGATGGGDAAVAAVSEALEALRTAHTAPVPPSAPEAVPDLADVLAGAGDPEVAPEDLEPTTDEVLAVEPVADEVRADAAGDPLEGLPAEEELELVPVAPEVFDVADEGQPADHDGSDHDGSAHDGSAHEQRPADEPSSTADAVTPDADAATVEEAEVSPADLGQPGEPDLGDVDRPDEPAQG